MAISVDCECGKTLKLKDSAAGKRLKCPDCGVTLDVPDAFDDEVDDYDEQPARRSSGRSRTGRRAAPKKDNSALLIGLVVGGLLAAGIGLGAFFALRRPQAPPVIPIVAENSAAQVPVNPPPVNQASSQETPKPVETPQQPVPVTTQPIAAVPAAATGSPYWLVLSNFALGTKTGPFDKPYSVSYRTAVGAPQAGKKYVLYVGQGSGGGFIEHYIEVDVNLQASGKIDFVLGPGIIGSGKLSAYLAEKAGHQKWVKVSGEITVGGPETAPQPPPSVAQLAGAAAVGKTIAIANAKVGPGFAGRTEITVDYAIQGTIPADGFFFMVAKNPAGNGVEFDVTSSLRRHAQATNTTLGGGVIGPAATGPFTIHIEKRKNPFRTPFDRDAPEILSNSVTTQ